MAEMLQLDLGPKHSQERDPTHALIGELKADAASFSDFYHETGLSHIHEITAGSQEQDQAQDSVMAGTAVELSRAVDDSGKEISRGVFITAGGSVVGYESPGEGKDLDWKSLDKPAIYTGEDQLETSSADLSEIVQPTIDKDESLQPGGAFRETLIEFAESLHDVRLYMASGRVREDLVEFAEDSIWPNGNIDTQVYADRNRPNRYGPVRSLVVTDTKAVDVLNHYGPGLAVPAEETDDEKGVYAFTAQPYKKYKHNPKQDREYDRIRHRVSQGQEGRPERAEIGLRIERTDGEYAQGQPKIPMHKADDYHRIKTTEIIVGDIEASGFYPEEYTRRFKTMLETIRSELNSDEISHH